MNNSLARRIRYRHKTIILNYIIYDIEATCWRGRPPKGINEVIEIGAVKINQYGENVSTFSKFVKPLVNPILSSFCKQLTKISQENIDRADDYIVVVDEFKEWIGVGEEDYVLGAWGDFDKRILRQNCELHKMDSEWVEFFINVKSQYNTIKGLGSNNRSGLKTIVEKEGFEFDGIQHRAISDAMNTGKVFSKYIDEWVIVW